jgi:aspartate carbamoyltransferase regulatory subunit
MDALRMGIVNFSSLADLMIPEVKDLSKSKKMNLNAVKMALIRYAEDIRKDALILEERVADVISKSVLELRNDLAVITIDQSSLNKTLPLLQKIKTFRFFQLTQGTDTATITIDSAHLDQVKSIFSGRDIVLITEEQSALVMISPQEIINVVGTLAYIINLLTHSNVNITQMLSCHTDTIFVVKRDDALRAFEIIERKILDLREIVSKKKKLRKKTK